MLRSQHQRDTRARCGAAGAFADPTRRFLRDSGARFYLIFIFCSARPPLPSTVHHSILASTSEGGAMATDPNRNSTDSWKGPARQQSRSLSLDKRSCEAEATPSDAIDGNMHRMFFCGRRSEASFFFCSGVCFVTLCCQLCSCFVLIFE